jgi:hypothetical protein
MALYNDVSDGSSLDDARLRWRRSIIVCRTLGGDATLSWNSTIGSRNQRMELRREHDVAVLAALALLDSDHHSLAVDVGDLQELPTRAVRGIDSGQRGAAFEARDRL